MRGNDLQELMPQLSAYHRRFHSFFCRSEGRKWSMKYLQGLMMSIERKNVENIAEEVDTPLRNREDLEKKTRSFMRTLIKRPAQVHSYFSHPKVAYAV